MNRFQSLSTALALVAVMTLAGCAGERGPAGPAGPPADRTKLYCSYSAATLSASNLTTSVTCKSVNDMPWTGGCEAADLPQGLYLEVNAPLNWEDGSKAAGWTCTWADFNGVPNLTFSANAEICCYSMEGT